MIIEKFFNKWIGGGNLAWVGIKYAILFAVVLTVILSWSIPPELRKILWWYILFAAPFYGFIMVLVTKTVRDDSAVAKIQRTFKITVPMEIVRLIQSMPFDEKIWVSATTELREQEKLLRAYGVLFPEEDDCFYLTTVGQVIYDSKETE